MTNVCCLSLVEGDKATTRIMLMLYESFTLSGTCNRGSDQTKIGGAAISLLSGEGRFCVCALLLWCWYALLLCFGALLQAEHIVEGVHSSARPWPVAVVH